MVNLVTLNAVVFMWGLCLRSHSDSSVSIGLVLTWKLNTSESTEMPSFLA